MTQVQICEHIKENGGTCGSPALTGYSFCYFHQRLRLPRYRPSDFEYKLPILDTPHAILMATQHVTQAALDGILEERRARLVLSALRLAMTAIKAIEKGDADRLASTGIAQTMGKEQSIREKESGNKESVAKEESAAKEVRVAENNNIVNLSSRGLLSGEGSGLVTATTEGQLATEPATSVAVDKKPPLSATQFKLMKKILRRGPSDPRFATAVRLLDHDIAQAHS